jgi:hypothetical protein
VSKHSVVLVSVALGALCVTAAPLAQNVRIETGGVVAPQIVRDPLAVSGPRTQTVPVGTGQVTGMVTAAATGSPIGRAVVRLTGPSRVSLQEATELMGRGRGVVPGSGQGRGVGGGQTARGGVAPNPAAAAQSAGRGGLNVNRTAISDSSGRFVFDHVPAGQYTLSVSKDQFLALNFGEKQYGRPGSPIVLEEGQRRDVPLRMTRAGAISGTVVGEDGQPLGSAQVRVARYMMTNGFRRAAIQRTAQSDDRGMFRVFGLVPGDYLVAVVPSSADLTVVARAMDDVTNFERALAAASTAASTAPRVIAMPLPDPQTQQTPPAGYLPTYFPGASTPASASVVTLRAGEEREGISIQVQPVRATNVTGTIAGLPVPATAAPGLPAVQVFSRPEDPASDMGMTMISGVNQQGTFTIRDLAPGRYTIYAQTRPNSPALTGVGLAAANAPVEVPRLAGRANVVVDGSSDPAPIVITLAPGRTISGRVVVADGQPFRGAVTLLPEPAAVPVPMLNPMTPAQVAGDGTFTIADVFPGRYLFRLPAARSAIVDGQDALDFAFEVTESRDVADVVITIGRPATLSGQLTESGGAPTSDFTIVLAPTDSRYWLPQSRRIQTARPGLDGAYRFPPMPPGTYMLAALSVLEPGAQFVPQVLRELVNVSLPVTLTDGATATQDIRLAR